jgi:hypothetical protein
MPAVEWSVIIILATLLPFDVQAETFPADSADRAAIVLARYTAGVTKVKPWSQETIEIEASLPSLEKHGRLRAIRRLLPFGKPEYHVLETVGDQTVRQEVIYRYLSADAQSVAVPTSSVAITPANYKFRYKGAVKITGDIAYSFVITPHKKRSGLIKGELWLDGETGAAVRQSGYLVKNPSIFIRRITVTRETTIRDGLPKERITHLLVDTRIVGRAELTIHERPCSDCGGVADAGQ